MKNGLFFQFNQYRAATLYIKFKFASIFIKLKFCTHILQSLLFLLELAIDLHEGLLGLIKLVLDGLDLLLELSGLLLGLQHRKYNYRTRKTCFTSNHYGILQKSDHNVHPISYMCDTKDVALVK